MKNVERAEIKINIEECKQPYIDNLILGLAHCGYSPYFSFDNKEICFEVWSDEAINYIEKD